MTNVFDRMASGDEQTGEQTESSLELTNVTPTDESTATSAEVKEVTQQLLKYGYIEEAGKAALFRRAIVRESQISDALEPLDLVLRLDTHRGVAFLAVAEAAYDSSDEGGAWAHPLVRRQRLTLEQSLLIAILRQAFVMHEQESGIGYGVAKMALDELLPQFLAYFDDSGSDAKNESRLSSLLDQLKTYGIVSEIDKNQQVTIRPMIAHLANPESLGALLQVLKERAETSVSANDDLPDAHSSESEG